ncbi:hypothetical protein SprV_0902689100 [Sparganum proliferum]
MGQNSSNTRIDVEGVDVGPMGLQKTIKILLILNSLLLGFCFVLVQSAAMMLAVTAKVEARFHAACYSSSATMMVVGVVIIPFACIVLVKTVYLSTAFKSILIFRREQYAQINSN